MTTITSMMSMSNNFGVVTDNMTAVVNLLMGFLAFLNIGSVNNLLTLLLGDLAGVLLGVLVALLVLLVMTTGARGVSMATSLSFTLVVSSIVATMMDSNNLRVMTNNVRAVVDLLVFLLTMSSDYMFTLFNVSDINDNIIFSLAFIMSRLFGNLMALLVLLVMAMRSTGVPMASCFWRGSAENKRCREKEN